MATETWSMPLLFRHRDDSSWARASGTRARDRGSAVPAAMTGLDWAAVDAYARRSAARRGLDGVVRPRYGQLRVE
jgi:hypothetical protein